MEGDGSGRCAAGSRLTARSPHFQSPSPTIYNCFSIPPPPSFFPLPALQEADLARLPSAVAGLQEAVNRANQQLRQLRALQPAALRCGGTCGRRLEHPLPEHSFRLRQRQSAVGQTIKWGRMHRLALCY